MIFYFILCIQILHQSSNESIVKQWVELGQSDSIEVSFKFHFVSGQNLQTEYWSDEYYSSNDTELIEEFEIKKHLNLGYMINYINRKDTQFLSYFYDSSGVFLCVVKNNKIVKNASDSIRIWHNINELPFYSLLGKQ